MSFIGLALNIWRDVGGTGGGGSWILAPGGVVATLDIDFVNNRAWNSPNFVAISSLLTCTRATPPNASYTTASGSIIYFGANTLRYGNNGLLIEEQRINIALRSQEMATSPWGRNGGSIVADNAIAPDGTLTADSLTATSGIGQDQFQDFTGTAAIYTHSIYIKKTIGTVRYCAVGFFQGGVYYVSTFNPTTGVIGSDPVGNTSIVESVGNYWRFSITRTLTVATWTLIYYPSYNDNGSQTGNAGTATFDFWGAQCELGAFATSYIPTVATSVTRAADIVVFTTVDWFSGVSDSIYSQWTVSNINNAKIWAFDATNDKLLDEQTGMSARLAGATVANTAAAGTVVKIGARMAVNDYAISMNGGAVATDVAETAPGTLTASRLGVDLAGANSLNNYIKRVAAFEGTLFSNAILQSMST